MERKAKRLVWIGCVMLCAVLLLAGCARKDDGISTIKPKYQKAGDVAPYEETCTPSIRYEAAEYDAQQQGVYLHFVLEGYSQPYSVVDHVSVYIYDAEYEKIGSISQETIKPIQDGKVAVELWLQDPAKQPGDLSLLDAEKYDIQTEVYTSGPDPSKEATHHFRGETLAYSNYKKKTEDGLYQFWAYNEKGTLTSYTEPGSVTPEQKEEWSFRFADGGGFEKKKIGSLIECSRSVSIIDVASVYYQYGGDGRLISAKAYEHSYGDDLEDMEYQIKSGTWVGVKSGEDRTDLMQSILSGAFLKAKQEEKAAKDVLAAFKSSNRVIALSEGYLLLQYRLEHYLFIDLERNQLGDAIWDEARPFREGLAYVEAGGKSGFIDTSGKMVIDLGENAWARDFYNGYAGVFRKDSFALIDKTGKEVFAQTVTRESGIVGFGAYNDGLLPVWMQADHYPYHIGFMDLKGNVVIPPNYGKAGSSDENIDRDDPAMLCFSEGLAVVTPPDDKEAYGYINTKGEPVGELQWSFAYPFREGLGCVRSISGGYRYGYVNKKGEVAIEPYWTSAKPFSEGLARVRDPETKLCGFIDQTGKYVIPPTWENAGSFCEGLAAVYDDSYGAYYINKKGEVVIDCGSLDPTDFDGDYAVLDGTSTWYVIDRNGNTIL